MTVLTSKCYVEHIYNLQGHIDSAVEAHPELRGVVPTFTYDSNSIGPNLVTGMPLHDPFILIQWDTGTTGQQTGE